MIRYPISVADLNARIKAVRPTWLARANRRTNVLRLSGRFDETNSIWSEVKPVFIEIQFGKCVFCERQFETLEFGTIEYDLEHFRPKSAVRKWPDPSVHNLNYPFATGDAMPSGYYWLAYDLQNYAACCKVCNSPLKSDYFPIAGPRAQNLADEKQLRAENPFLCYPIGDWGDDPEALISFVGTTAIPSSPEPAKRNRGQVIIDFFRLNEREHLHQQRAQMIILLGNSLTLIAAGIAGDAEENVVAACTTSRMPHAACSRSFRKMWNEDNASALRILDACKSLIAQ